MGIDCIRREAILPLAAALLGLSACSTSPMAPALRNPQTMVSPVDAALNFLNKGDEPGAMKQIRKRLKQDPNDAAAHVLLESIQRDPVELLGSRNFGYTVQPGDTMLSLSERFLGNRLKFYQLSRYNGLENPSALAAGTVVRIPGEPPRPAPVRSGPSGITGEGAEPSHGTRPKTTPAETKTTNPAVAVKLRSLALSALNQGRVDQAIQLLKRAASLDPDNPLIARDLSRSERIGQAVRARR